jgi:3-methyladenine DNA glycosylase AlkD
MTQALFFAEQHKDAFDTKTLFTITKNWITKIDNWAHSDGLSGLFSYLLEKDAKLVYPQSGNRETTCFKKRRT